MPMLAEDTDTCLTHAAGNHRQGRQDRQGRQAGIDPVPPPPPPPLPHPTPLEKKKKKNEIGDRVGGNR